MAELATKDAAPLPVPVEGAGGLPATIDAHARLGAELKMAAEVLDGCDIPALRRAQRTLPRLRQAFALIDRPATSEEIVLGINSIIRTKPLAGNIDADALADMLMAEIAAEGATLFELAAAVRAHFRTAEFLCVPKLLDEVAKARRAARRHRETLAADVRERIAEIEDWECRRERERTRTIAVLRKAVEELRRDGNLRFPVYQLPGVRYLDPSLLMEALDEEDRARQWATLLPPDRDRLLHDGLPDGWTPPDDELADETSEEVRDEAEDGDEN